jgi:uridine phosphorylase
MNEAIIDPVPPPGGGEPGRVALLVSNGRDLDTLVRLAGRTGCMESGRVFASRFHSVGSGENRITLAGPFIGAPYSVMILETLIAWGVCNFVLLGWCGAISQSVHIGDLVIPDAALVDEGTSRHYRSDGSDLSTREPVANPCPQLTEALAAAMPIAGGPVHRGVVWTTDAIYRETRDRVTQYRDAGVLAVEMEASALFSVASCRGVSMAGCLVVSDELGSLEWRPGFRLASFKEARRRVASGLLEALPAL